MIEVEWTGTIGRLPDDVFRHVADVERYPEWQRAAGIRRVERDDDGPLAVGSRFRIERVTQGQAGTLEATVTGFEPGRRFAFQARDSAGFDVETEISLAADGAGTRLTWRFTMTTPGLLRFAGSMLSREIHRAAEADFATFKARLEQVA
jgi:carbon monoxide dehydrogenase subunit G